MRKLLKGTAIALGVVIALLLILVVALPFVFDPNRYRDDIVKTVKEQTGRDLKIEGKLGWSILPRLAIEANRLELGNATGFGREPFARIEAAGVQVAWLPLFSGRVSVETFYLDGLALHLAKNAAGKTNWEDLAKPREPKAVQTPAAAKPGADDSAPPVGALAIGRLDIRNTSLSYRDEQAASALAIRHLALGTGRFEADKPFDLKLSFEFVRDRETPVRCSLEGRVTVGADALKFDNLRLVLDDSRLTGAIDVQHFAHPSLRFDLALDQLDLDRYLPKDAVRPAPEAKAAATGSGELPVAMLRDLDVDGKFRAGQLKAFNLRLSDAQIFVRAKDGIVRLGPNSAKAYGGLYRGVNRLDARGQSLTVTLDESLKGVALDALLKDAIGLDKFRGTTNLELKLAGQGADVAALKTSLNGTAAFGVQNGVIAGVDLKKFNDTLDAALKAKSTDKLSELKPAPGDQTAFTHLGGNAKIVNGVIHNDDLKIDAPGLLAVSGKGSADLAHESLDYTVRLGRLPVRISGPFSGLSYKPDLKAVASAEAAAKIVSRKEAAKQKLKDKLKR